MTKSSVSPEVSGEDMPTARQIHSWASKGLLGRDHQGVGSGFRHQWSEREKEILRVLHSLDVDLRRIGMQFSGELVGMVWTGLHSGPSLTLTSGMVSFRLSLPEAYHSRSEGCGDVQSQDRGGDSKVFFRLTDIEVSSTG